MEELTPKAKFYCQNTCGTIGFSIDEWNETDKALNKIALSEKEKNKILFPPHCNNQCFDCLAIVGERQCKTSNLI